MITSSVCLYWAGMALNDLADRHLDADERPERPIPSGRVSAGEALSLYCGLTSVGLVLAGLAGRRSGLMRATALAAVAAAYDLVLKPTPAGPATMALARVLNVGMGMSRPGAAAAPAALIGAHTYTVTALSRHEIRGGGRWLPMATLAGSTAVGVAATLSEGRVRSTRHPLADAAAAVYLSAYGGAQVRAVGNPTADNIRSAVAAGIFGLLPLQAALAATSGAPATATSLVIGHLLARGFARKTPVT